MNNENIILCGHTRYYAAKRLQLDKVPIIKVSDLTPAQEKAYRIADNKTTEFAKWDNELLSLELEGLQDLEFNLDLTGFEGWEFDNLLCQEEGKDEKERKDISDTIKEQYELIIECDNESELENIYEELVERGFKCRISTL